MSSLPWRRASYSRPVFIGRERATIELDGAFRPGAVAVPPRLSLELDNDGRARVRLFAFHVERLRVARLPLVRASYAELLWRVAVRAGDTPAWWVIACDLGARVPRVVAARFIKYPVRDQRVEVSERAIASRGAAGALALALGPPGDSAVAIEQRPLLVGAAAEYEVPWGDDGAPGRPALVTVEEDTLGEATLGATVAWAPAATLRVDREHRCGVARLR